MQRSNLVHKRLGFLALFTPLAFIGNAITWLTFDFISFAFHFSFDSYKLPDFYAHRIEFLGPPAAVLALGILSLGIDFLAMGWKESSLKRLLVLDDASTVTDWFYFYLSYSGLKPVLAFLMTGGIAYGITHSLSRLFDFSLLKSASFGVSLATLSVVNTFAFYWVHRVMHSRWFWNIHKIHHSATEFNVITPHRNHPIDYVVVQITHCIPAAVMGVRFEVLTTYMIFNAIYQQLAHSGLTGPSQWLEWIFITPRAHRLHHSTDPKHYHTNYGIISIWDRLFGTYVAPDSAGVSPNISIGLLNEPTCNTGKPFAEIFSIYLEWGQQFISRKKSTDSIKIDRAA